MVFRLSNGKLRVHLTTDSRGNTPAMSSSNSMTGRTSNSSCNGPLRRPLETSCVPSVTEGDFQGSIITASTYLKRTSQKLGNWVPHPQNNQSTAQMPPAQEVSLSLRLGQVLIIHSQHHISIITIVKLMLRFVVELTPLYPSSQQGTIVSVE